MISTSHVARRSPASGSSWRRTFVTGLLLWIASVLVTGLTGNLNMIPTVVLLGSFLVPTTAVVWYFDHYHSEVVTPALAARAFIVGGVLGVLAASIVESLLSTRSPALFLGVGLIEEIVKLLALLVVARSLSRYTVRDGIVLGAAVGFGFAALESSGYALNSLIVREGRTVVLSLGDLVWTELPRGILAPLVGHGLWTAILGGALFAASRQGRLRLSWGVVGAYLLVSVLHGLWDSMDLIANVLTALYFTLSPFADALIGVPRLRLRDGFIISLGFYFAGLIVLSLVGLLLLRRRWRAGGPTDSVQEVQSLAA